MEWTEEFRKDVIQGFPQNKCSRYGSFVLFLHEYGGSLVSDDEKLSWISLKSITSFSDIKSYRC